MPYARRVMAALNEVGASLQDGVGLASSRSAEGARTEPSADTRTDSGRPANRNPVSARSPVGRPASGSERGRDPCGRDLSGRNSSVPAGASGRGPSSAVTIAIAAAADQACGRQDAG